MSSLSASSRPDPWGVLGTQMQQTHRPEELLVKGRAATEITLSQDGESPSPQLTGLWSLPLRNEGIRCDLQGPFLV